MYHNSLYNKLEGGLLVMHAALLAGPHSKLCYAYLHDQRVLAMCEMRPSDLR